MFFPWVSVLTLLPILEGPNGESVTQPDDRMTVSQGEPVLLKCTYDNTPIPTLWWYEQYSNKAPRLLLKQRGFCATPEKQESFHLKKNLSELSDSAVYYCGMSDTEIAHSRVAAEKPTGGR
uniref:Ig-like domain-containing protein n=1 Tax=Gopherus evgoodei TaxID=1825980 RepID=A0A8C4Y730_9SAUR